MNLKQLCEDSKQQYERIRKEVFDGEDFPAVASKVMVNKTLYTMDEILKYTQVFAKYYMCNTLLKEDLNQEEQFEKVKEMEENLRERYPIHDNVPVLVGQAAEQVRSSIRGEKRLDVQRAYEPIRRAP